MSSRLIRPGAWLPVLALVALAGYLAEVVRPWPEGRILFAPRGLGPHGVTASDVIVLAVVVVASLAWLRLWGRAERSRSARSEAPARRKDG